MTTDVVLTGTGIPTVSPERAGPGVLVRCGDASLQFDAGRATTMRLAAAGVACGDLTALFITHHHSDHMVGLPDVLMSRWILPHDRRDEPLTIIVPDGEGARIAGHMLDVWRNELQTRAEHVGRTLLPVTDVVAFAATAEPQVVWESDTIRVLSCLVHHEPLVPAVAYRIETPDGVVAISGDTRPCEEMERLAAGADVLVHEAMRSTLSRGAAAAPSRPSDASIIHYHADTIEVARLAQRAGVRTLVLTHLIPAPTTDRHRDGYVADARAGGFEGDVVVGYDLYRHSFGQEK